MPRGDRTGLNGMGPLTGRGLGYCNEFNAPGFVRNFGGIGRFFGRGGGRGWGFGRRFAEYLNEPPVSSVSEAKYIETEISELKEALASMEKRLTELKKTE